jgi:hypothetical protein
MNKITGVLMITLNWSSTTSVFPHPHPLFLGWKFKMKHQHGMQVDKTYPKPT